MSSIRKVIARLSAPQVLIKPLPRFGQSVMRQSLPNENVPNQERERVPSPTTWSGFSERHEQFDLKAVMVAKAEKGELRVLAIGEQHNQPSVLKLQLQMIDFFSDLHPDKTVLVVEYFNLQQNEMLKSFAAQEIDLEELASRYAQSEEGFDLNHLAPILLLAQEKSIPVVGGFPPRQWARELIRDREGVQERLRREFGYDRARQDLRTLNWGHEAHFESMLSGQPPKESDLVRETGRRGQTILPAQVIKDSVMAWSIDEQLQRGKSVVAIAGAGHLEYSFGVMERLRKVKKEETFLLVTKSNRGSELWINKETGSGDDRADEIEARTIADAVYLYDAVEETENE